LAGHLSEIISQLEQQRKAIERALSALRDVEGIESPAPNAATATAPAALAVRTGGRPQSGDKRSGALLKKRSAVKKARGGPPIVNAPVSDSGKAVLLEVPLTRVGQAKKLTAGTMKARTVELLRMVGKPMISGEVAKRMKIGRGYASVNLSQLRRDGFLSHTAEGYAVI
jgi:hypothetical protein